MPPGLAGQPLRYGELHHSLFITQPPIRDRPFAPPTWVLNLSATDPLAPPTWVLDLSVTDPLAPPTWVLGLSVTVPVSPCPLSLDPLVMAPLTSLLGAISYDPSWPGFFVS